MQAAIGWTVLCFGIFCIVLGIVGTLAGSGPDVATGARLYAFSVFNVGTGSWLTGVFSNARR